MADKEINFTIALKLCMFCAAEGTHKHSYRELLKLFKALPEGERQKIWDDYSAARDHFWDWNNFVISIIAYYTWIAKQREMDARAGIADL